MSEKVNKPVTFILSTGRTGTQFFSKYLNETCNHVLSLHEPHPSRRFKWYSNYYLKGKLSKVFIAKQYVQNRKKIWRSEEVSHYVESSNFLFGCVEPVKVLIPDLSVVHIIRDPLSYTKSHLNKGFWSGIKGFTAKNIPGWLEFMDPEIVKSNDPVLILLARWIYVNQTILAYQKDTKYLGLRFEDIFSAKASNPVKELDKVRTFLDCRPLSKDEQSIWLTKSSNKSQTNRSEKWPISEEHIAFLKKEGASLLDKFNYSIDQ